MSRVAFVGDRVSGSAFRPLGVEVWEAEDAESAPQRVEEALQAGCDVLLITEACALWAEEKLEDLRASALPAVAVVPGVTSRRGLGLARLKRNVERALGSDFILQEDAPEGGRG
ncbi:MAG: V-type ATP synthase subunit F [Nitrospinota bacterium]